LKAKELVKATATLMSRDVGLMDYASGMNSLALGNGRPWIWDMASVEYSTDTTTANLSADPDFEEFSVTFTLPHDGVPFLDGTKKYGEFVPSDFRRITIEGTKSFRNEDAYLAFRNYEQHRLRMTTLNVNSILILGDVASADATKFSGYPGFRLTLPAMKYTKWSAPIKGANRLQASFSAKAEYDEAEGFSALFEVLNSTPNSIYVGEI
jgi:hypothetical protein